MGNLAITIPYKFWPRQYQLNLMAMVPGRYKRGVFVHHRRAGKDKCAWNKIVSEALKKPAVYYYFFPTYQQGKKVIWDGIDPRTGLKYLDHVPAELIKKKHDTELKLELANGSIVQIVGTDNYDAIMGTPPYGCVFSEFSLQDPRAWDFIRPILRENKGWAIFIYTPRGENHGWQLYDMALRSEKWFAELLTIRDTKREDGTPVISEADIEEDRNEGMSDELIEQEYYCSFKGHVLGAYYSKQFALATAENRITAVPHIPTFEVYTTWDLGYDDSTTIWFFQHINQQIRFIDYYENTHEGMGHYAKILKEKPYVYGDHFLPHDAASKLQAENAESREEILNRLGFPSTKIVQRPKDSESVLNGIEAMRNKFSQCWFDETKCKLGINALKSYHAEYDEKRKILHRSPDHDWSSHAADAIRTFAVGYKQRRKQKTVYDIMAERHR